MDGCHGKAHPIFTPRHLVALARSACIVMLVALTAITLRDFEFLEGVFSPDPAAGLSPAALSIAFYILSVVAFVATPRLRRTDIGIAIVGYGVSLQMVQGGLDYQLNGAGVLAVLLGVGSAVLPGMIERLRHDCRRHPYMSFADITRQDRRNRGASSRPPRQARLP